MAARSLLESLRDRAVEGRIPSWLLGAALALLTWRVTFVAPSFGLDLGWHTGLAMALQERLQFGSEVIFTYGPLGFLDYPGVWYQDLAVLAFLYSALIYIAFCAALVWALRRTLPTWVAVGVAYLILALLPGIEQPIALAAILGLAMLQRDGPALGVNAFALALASLAAIEALIKISVGPVVLVIGLMALIGLRAHWWQLAGFLALFAAELGLLWVLSGQDLGGLPDFVTNSEQIVTGYNEGMALRTFASVWSLLAVLVPLGVIVASLAGRYRDSLARWAALAMVGITAFSLFKQGVVRFDPPHVAVWLSNACLLWLAIPWDPTHRAAMISGAAVFGIFAIHAVPPVGSGLDTIAHVRFAYEETKNVLIPSRRIAIEDEARATMRAAYALEPETLAALEAHSVSVDPWEIGVIWAYELEWAPLPVFQNYSAYTRHLDDLNATEIEDPAGPERILRTNSGLVVGEWPTRGLDDRFPSWDPPAQALATLCHFAPLHTTDRWQVLGRVPDRCGEPRPIGSVDASFDEVVEVPTPGPREVVFARIDGVEVDGFERLSATVWRPRSRYAIVNGDEAQRYRVVPGTAVNGLIMRASDNVAGGEGPFSQTPQAETIELTGVGGELRFEFFAMEVRPAGAAES